MLILEFGRTFNDRFDKMSINFEERVKESVGMYVDQ